jgi:hypothetical protein
MTLTMQLFGRCSLFPVTVLSCQCDRQPLVQKNQKNNSCSGPNPCATNISDWALNMTNTDKRKILQLSGHILCSSTNIYCRNHCVKFQCVAQYWGNIHGKMCLIELEINTILSINNLSMMKVLTEMKNSLYSNAY